MSVTQSNIGIEKESFGWSVGISTLMIIVGALAIILPPIAGVAVTLLVGWLLVFSGVAHFIYAWHAHSRRSVIWEILLGILYVAIGGYVLINPIAGLVSLTLALAIYLIFEGVLELTLSYQLRTMQGAGWLLFDGIITLVLAALIGSRWPSNSAWAIGVLLGISMLFSGIARLMLALTVHRRLVAKPA
jgi:uncharacterized membrane protein HdeD (DUF308 family)